MRTKLFLLITFVLVIAQGWAAPIDSLKVHLDDNNAQSTITEKADGIGNLSDLVIPSNAYSLVTDLVHPDGTVETTSTSTTGSNSQSVPVGSSIIYTFTFKSYYTSHVPAKLVDNSGMYTMTKTLLSTGSNYKEWKIVVRYKPTSSGNHKATLFLYVTLLHTIKISFNNTAVVPQIGVSPTSLNFGTVAKGYAVSKTINVTGTNLTGNLTLSTNSSYYTVSPTTITAAQAAAGKTVTVTYKPTVAGTHNATLTIKGGSAASKTVSLSGKCAEITTNVSSLNFGTTAVNKAVTNTLTVKGVNLTGNLTLSTNSSYYTVSPTTITAAQAAAGKTVTVTYKPTAGGTHNATLTIKGGSAANKPVSLSGKCAEVTTNVSSLNFGTTAVNKAVSKSVTVKGVNLTGNLTLSTSNSRFTVSPTSITAAEAAAGKTVTVTYKPTAAGSHSGTITVSGGGASPKTVSVTGKCENPPTPTITVSTTSLLFAGYLDTKTFKVTGTNLTGNLTVTISGSYFTVSPTTITVAEAKAGKNVLVQCVAPITVQRATGTVTISGGGAASKTVRLSYDATGPVPYAPVVEPEGGSEDDNEVFMNGGSLSVNENMTTDVDELAMASKVYAEGQVIIIESPVEQEAIVSDLSGRAQRVNLQTGRNEIPVNTSGVYIVRIKDKSTKLMFR